MSWLFSTIEPHPFEARGNRAYTLVSPERLDVRPNDDPDITHWLGPMLGHDTWGVSGWRV